MNLRVDEEHVANCLVHHFGGGLNCQYRIGENPPDIYLKVKGVEYPVEITSLNPIYFDENGSVKNRKTIDSSTVKFVNYLNKKLDNSILDTFQITIVLKTPVKNIKKFREELVLFLQNLIKNGLKIGRLETGIDGKKVEIFIFDRISQKQEKIVGIVENKNSNTDVLYNVQIIVLQAIQNKQKQCQKIKNPKWLALLNSHVLVDDETYRQAIKTISFCHDFDKIFLIVDNKVLVLT